ncbi:MAG: short-chain dehydrogenase [Anaerolineales bacterium]|nr:SDR family oxidoreductase [Anaerolineae bacterium]PWB53876.1 MAG: short-chain dehydrogenase [Anaerolineales bacterium]
MKIKAQLGKGKVALVTGGSSGIGKAVACALAMRGMHVCLLAQRQELLDSALTEVEKYRENKEQLIATISADVSDWDSVQKAMQIIMKQSGTPDILINAAGVAHPGYVQDLDLSIFNWMMQVNYFGTVYATKALLPGMVSRGSGYIVNISSVAGFIGTFGYTAYGASKFAVRGFSDALRQELKLYGIGVSVVFPGDTQTAQLEYENKVKPPETKALAGNTKVMSADDVARIIITGIEHGQYKILPGAETKLLYLLNNIVGGTLASVMDQIVAKANRKKNPNLKEA